jgi:hypothetical protein
LREVLTEAILAGKCGGTGTDPGYHPSMSDFWPSKRILLTGGAGFFGTALSLGKGLRRTIDRYRANRDLVEQATF